MGTKFKNLALSLTFYMVLFMGAVVVLLPLFWMGLTACKQSGQALEFRFLPSSTVEGPKKILRPLKPGEGRVIFEYDPAKFANLPAPNRVSVAGEFNGWDKSRDMLVWDGSLFVTTITGLKPGKYSYKFVINGKTWIRDLSNPAQTPDGNSVIAIAPGQNSNKPLADSSKIQGEKIIFHITRPQVASLEIKMGKEIFSLSKKGTAFVGERSIEPGKPVEYRILEPQTFREGLAKIYTLKNFSRVLSNPDFPFGRFFLNSLFVAAGTALLTVFLCTLAGYGFAKKEFFLRKQIFFLLMSTMMIPGMIFMVPQFALVNNLGWINSYQGMMVPHLANIFGLFLMKQYIATIPNSLFEAAYLDGAREWQVFKIIILPLSLPIMVTLFLMTFVAQWGNFLWQLIVNTPDSPYRTLPVGLALFRGQYGQDWEMLMAGACFSILPIAFLFLLAQRFFMEGMTSGAVKE